jgi:hypothetical protein
MATNKQWLTFSDALGLVEETVRDLMPKVPVERFVQECLKEHRPDLVGIDHLSFVLPVALLSAACASGKSRAGNARIIRCAKVVGPAPLEARGDCVAPGLVLPVTPPTNATATRRRYRGHWQNCGRVIAARDRARRLLRPYS